MPPAPIDQEAAAVALGCELFELAAQLGASQPALQAHIEAAAIRAVTALRLQVRGAAMGDPHVQSAIEEAITVLLIAIRMAPGKRAMIEPIIIRLRSTVRQRDPESPVTPAPVSSPKASAGPGSARARTEAVSRPADYLVVDGCNFLGRAQGFRLGDPESRDRLQEYALRHPSQRVVVFYDGQKAARRLFAGIEERVVSDRRSADEAILAFLDAMDDITRRRSIVISDDRELTERSKALGCRCEAIGWLASRIQRADAPKGTGTRPSGVSR